MTPIENRSSLTPLVLCLLIYSLGIASTQAKDISVSEKSICRMVMSNYTNAKQKADGGRTLGTKVNVGSSSFRIDDSGTLAVLIVKKANDQEPIVFAETIEFWKRLGKVYALINLATRNRRGSDKTVLELHADGQAIQVCKFRQEVKYSTIFFSQTKIECDGLALENSNSFVVRLTKLADRASCSMGSGCTFGEIDVDIDNDGSIDKVLVERSEQGGQSDYTRLYLVGQDGGKAASSYFDQMYALLDKEGKKKFPFAGLDTGVVRYKERNYVSIESNDYKKNVFLIDPKTKGAKLVCKLDAKVELH